METMEKFEVERGDGEAIEERSRGTVTTDSELVALNRVFKTIEKLSDESKERVLKYIVERFEDYLEDN